jgi:hypothetical protein
MTFPEFQNQTKKNINPTRINRLGATVGNEHLEKSTDLWLLFAHVLYHQNQSGLREMDFRLLKMRKRHENSD